MKSISLKVVLYFTICLAIVSCTGGCKDSDSGPWAKFKPLNEIDKHIDGYYSASLGEASNPKSGNAAVYIDFSDGLVQAYTKNPSNVQIMQAITNKLVSKEIQWYSLGDAKISKLEFTSNELFNKVSDPKQYKTIMAPIQEALKTITSANNDALLVTDYEEYTPDGKEQFENYPKSYFIDWLKKGNSITFFYTNYTEVNAKTKISSDKHLYFTVFTHGRSTETSIVSQIKDALKGRSFTIKQFDLNNNPYTVSNDYGGKEMTGIVNKSFAKYVTYNNNALLDKKLPFEAIGLNKPWNEELDKYVKNIIEKEEGILINRLFLNASDQTSYKLGKLTVNVYDVSEDYEKYAQCEEAKIHSPKLEKDPGKNDAWTKESAKDPITSSCYEPKTTNIKKEWIYVASNSKDDLKPVEELFGYDEKIFGDHLKNSPDKIELITKFHKNYKLKNVKKTDALLRVDYVIDDASFNDSNPQLADFQWTSTTVKNTPNNSLAEAIRNTLIEPSVSPKGRIVYSYFIKLNNPSKTEK